MPGMMYLHSSNGLPFFLRNGALWSDAIKVGRGSCRGETPVAFLHGFGELIFVLWGENKRLRGKLRMSVGGDLFHSMVPVLSIYLLINKMHSTFNLEWFLSLHPLEFVLQTDESKVKVFQN